MIDILFGYNIIIMTQSFMSYLNHNINMGPFIRIKMVRLKHIQIVLWAYDYKL